MDLGIITLTIGGFWLAALSVLVFSAWRDRKTKKK